MNPSDVQQDRRTEHVAIIVVNYGSARLVEANAAELARSGMDVVVVDNFSTAAERLRVLDGVERFGWQVCLPDGNPGFGAGVNQGVRRARELGHERFIALNPDASLSPDAAQGLAAIVGDAGTPTMAAPAVLRPDGSVWSVGHDLYLRDGRIRSTRRRADFPDEPVREWLTGACLAFDSRAWDLVGGFDEDYFLYWEDVDLSYRFVDAGGRLVLAEHLTCTHDEGGTQEAGAARGRSATYYYYNIRNRLLFAEKHLPAQVRAAWRGSAPSVAWEVLLQGGRRQFRHPLRPLGAMARGLRDGVRARSGQGR